MDSGLRNRVTHPVIPKATVSVLHAASAFFQDDERAGGGRAGVAAGLAHATLDDSWVSLLLLVIYLLNILFLHLYGH